MHLASKNMVAYEFLGPPVRKSAFTLGKNTTDTFLYNLGKCSFYWFNRYLCTGEHSQSDLEIFWFDFMFVKPCDLPPMFCFTCKMTRDFYYNIPCLQREGRRCKKFGVKSCCNKKNLMSVCMLKQNIGGISCSFTHINRIEICLDPTGNALQYIDID